MYMESSHSNNTGTMKFINGYHKTKLPPQTKQYWEELIESYDDPTSKYYDPAFDNKINSVPTDAELANMRPCLDGFPCILYVRQTANEAYQNRGIYNFNLDKTAPNTLGFKGNPKMMGYEISANSDIGSGAFRSYSWSGNGSVPSEFEVRYHPYEEDVIDANEIMIEGKHNEISRLIKWVVNCVEDNVVATIFDPIDIPAGTPHDQFQYYTDSEINAWLRNKGITPVVGYPAGRVLKDGAVANPDGSYDDDQYVTVPAKDGSRVNVMIGNRFIDAQGITQTLAGKQYVLQKSGPSDSDSNAHWVLPYRTTSTGYTYYAAGESQQFKNEVSQYFDIQYLIDYYTFVYTVAMVDISHFVS